MDGCLLNLGGHPTCWVLGRLHNHCARLRSLVLQVSLASDQRYQTISKLDKWDVHHSEVPKAVLKCCHLGIKHDNGTLSCLIQNNIHQITTWEMFHCQARICQRAPTKKPPPGEVQGSGSDTATSPRGFSEKRITQNVLLIVNFSPNLIGSIQSHYVPTISPCIPINGLYSTMTPCLLPESPSLHPKHWTNRQLFCHKEVADFESFLRCIFHIDHKGSWQPPIRNTCSSNGMLLI